LRNDINDCQACRFSVAPVKVLLNLQLGVDHAPPCCATLVWLAERDGYCL
jgi:hypothetical protein